MASCRTLLFKDHPALATKLEDCLLLWPFDRLIHFGREDQPCWLTVAGREVFLPGLFYLSDPKALAHHFSVYDLDKTLLRVVYRDLLCAVRRNLRMVVS